MSNNSLPDFEKVPTFDDVVAYAVEVELFGKLTLTKFYEYYAKQGFMYKGVLMDWRAKMHEWASRERTKVVITAKEYEAQARVKTRSPKYEKVTADDLWARIALI